MIKMRKILSDEILFCYKHIDQRVLFGSPPQELEFQARVARRNSSKVKSNQQTKSTFGSKYSLLIIIFCTNHSLKIQVIKYNWTHPDIGQFG